MTDRNLTTNDLLIKKRGQVYRNVYRRNALDMGL